MKSLFYGGAVAAITGLLIGTGLKMPALEEFEPMAEVVPGFETAAMSTDSAPAAYVDPGYYTAISTNAPADSFQSAAAAELKPAVFEVEQEEPAAAPVAYEPPVARELPMTNVYRSNDAVREPMIVERDQGFGLVDEAEAQPSI